MDTLTRTGVTVPANDGSDSTTAYRISLRALGQKLEAAGALYAQGLLASRPAAGTPGLLYKPTDTSPTDLTNYIYYDTGSAWVTLGVFPPTDPIATTPGLRTLGAGGQQAAAGNHTHDFEILARMGAL